MPKTDSENRERLNALLQKTGGDITNLNQQELQEMQQLVSGEIAKTYRETRDEFHRGKTPIASLLLEEMHQRRMNRQQICDTLCLSRVHFGKVLSGKAHIGMRAVQQIHQEFGIDANYLIENL